MRHFFSPPCSVNGIIFQKHKCDKCNCFLFKFQNKDLYKAAVFMLIYPPAFSQPLTRNAQSLSKETPLTVITQELGE